MELHLVQLEYPFDGRRCATFDTDDKEICETLAENFMLDKQVVIKVIQVKPNVKSIGNIVVSDE